MSIPRILDSFHSFASHPSATDYKMTSWCDTFLKLNALRSPRPGLRASGLFYTCPRAAVFDHYRPVMGDPYSFTSLMAMEIGTLAHSLTQNLVLGPLGVLHGRWSNANKDAEHKIHHGFHPDPELTMQELGSGSPLSWHFCEESLEDERLDLRGHHDGLVSLHRLDKIAAMPRKEFRLPLPWPEHYPMSAASGAGSEFVILEIKTAGSFSYKNMVRSGGVFKIPDAYKMQAAIYQRLSGYCKTLFWIISRDTFESACSVWADVDGRWWSMAVKKAMAIIIGIDDKKLPEEFRPCLIPSCARAKKCPYRTKCFDRKYSLSSDTSAGRKKDG